MHKCSTLLVLLSSGLISGCATSLQPDQCEKVNPQQLGLIDGEYGRPASHYQNHTSICPNLKNDVAHESYEKGRDEGLNFYCTPGNGFLEGSTGGTNYGECSNKPTAHAFEEQFSKGHALWIIKQERAQIENKIAAEEKQREEDRKQGRLVTTVEDFYYMFTSSSPTQDLEDQSAELGQQISEKERAAPRVALSMGRQQDELTKQQLGGGALVGTFLGFGIGHAMQGTYASNGWKWTAIDAGLIGAIAYTSNQYCNGGWRETAPYEYSYEPNCSNSLNGLSILAFLGARVWQSVELFKRVAGAEYQRADKSTLKWTLSFNRHGPLFLGSF
jgi:hypothetical protein